MRLENAVQAIFRHAPIWVGINLPIREVDVNQNNTVTMRVGLKLNSQGGSMMMQTRTMAVVLILSLFSFATNVSAQDSAIEKRKKLMKENSAASKAIKKAVSAMDYATVETKAKEIAENMDKAPELFPKGSTAEDSRAKAVIWEKWDEFSKKASNLEAAANDLAAAAASKNQAQVEENFKAVGNSCRSCHKPFRAPKKK